MNKSSLSRRRALGPGSTAKGFSLIEVVIAISVVALTFIGILGLLGVGVASNQTSSQQTTATLIAESILADLRSTPTYATAGKSTRYGLTLPTLPGSSSTAPLSGLPSAQTPVLYFDNSPILISLNPAAVPANAVYVAHVYMTRITVAGPTSTLATPTTSLLQSNDMVRVVVSWPAKTTTTPMGNVDVIAQFLIK